MLEARNLCSIRGERTLFTDLNVSIMPGEIVQIVGGNGTGKTSLLRVLAGLSRPECGTVCWQGSAIQRCREQYHHALLYLGHQPAIKAILTARENLALYHPAKSLHANQQIDQALTDMGLIDYAEIPAGQLSAGQQRRIALTRLALTQAPLWILDEPLTAIDQSGISYLMTLFSHHLQQDGMVVITSHQQLTGSQQPQRQIQLQEQPDVAG